DEAHHPRPPICRPRLKFRQPRSRSQSRSIQLPPRSSWLFATSKMPSASSNDSLILDFYTAPLMEFGVSARVERCKSSGLLTALARPTRGTKLHKNGCSAHQTRRLPIHPTSVSSVDGVLTLPNVASPLSRSRRAEPRPTGPHVNFIPLNGKARKCGDCEPSARARPNAG